MIKILSYLGSLCSATCMSGCRNERASAMLSNTAAVISKQVNTDTDCISKTKTRKHTVKCTAWHNKTVEGPVILLAANRIALGENCFGKIASGYILLGHFLFSEATPLSSSGGLDETVLRVR